jgi:hypothetical protein
MQLIKRHFLMEVSVEDEKKKKILERIIAN